jgi:MFS transporter, DHA1 family, multidrug resistance protein
MGALQFLLAAIVAPLVGIAGEDTAVPMAAAMLISAALGLASLPPAETRARPSDARTA